MRKDVRIYHQDFTVSLKYRVVLVFYKVTFSVTRALPKHQVFLRNYQKFCSTLLRFF